MNKLKQIEGVIDNLSREVRIDREALKQVITKEIKELIEEIIPEEKTRVLDYTPHPLRVTNRERMSKEYEIWKNGYNEAIKDIKSKLEKEKVLEKYEDGFWVTKDSKGEIIKKEKYTHQDGNFSNLCGREYCCCSN